MHRWPGFAVGMLASMALAWLASDAHARLETPVLITDGRGPANAAVSATVRVEGLRFDPAARAIRGRLTATLKGPPKGMQLTSATLLWPEADGASATMQRVAETEFTAWSEADAQGVRTPTADIRLEVEVVPTRVRSLLLYPYDTYVVPLRFGICVTTLGDTVRDCLEPNVLLAENQLLSDAEFELALSTDGNGDVLLSRLGFVRVASLIFLIAASAFFAVVLWVPPGNGEGYFLDLFGKLLGFLGVLGVIRTFLVPRTITTFPLLIDYISLALFVAVFAMTGIRMLSMHGTARQEDKWVD
jgi:hypothetical protein